MMGYIAPPDMLQKIMQVGHMLLIFPIGHMLLIFPIGHMLLIFPVGHMLLIFFYCLCPVVTDLVHVVFL
jgi:hypothetical protein